MRWYESPAGYNFKHVTEEDFDYMYYEVGRGNPGAVYKVSYKRDKTGAKVPEMYLHKSERDMKEGEVQKIKDNWIKADTLRYEDIDPHTYFKSLYVIVKDKNKLPARLRDRVFTTYLDPKLSNLVKPKTKEKFGDILDNL